MTANAAPRLSPKEIVYENPHQRVYRVVADFGSFRKEYYVTDYGPRAAVVAVRDDEILLVRQYRMLIGRVSREIPGGRVEGEETPEEAARRECLEEAGIWCRELRPLIHFHPGLDTVYNPTSVFVCADFETRESSSDAREATAVEWVSVDQAVKWAFDGTICDSLSVLSILAYDAWRKRPQETTP